MTDPLCPTCGLRPRHRSPGGQVGAWCKPCRNDRVAKRRVRLGIPPRPRQAWPTPARPKPTGSTGNLSRGEPLALVGPAAGIRARAIADGSLHVVADLSYSEGWTRCSCGLLIEEENYEPLAGLMNAHLKETRAGAQPGRASG